MSKKDYQALASLMHRSKVKDPSSDVILTPTDERARSEMRFMWTTIMGELIAHLATDNPRFNRALFIEACETGKCKGMRK